MLHLSLLDAVKISAPAEIAVIVMYHNLINIITCYCNKHCLVQQIDVFVPGTVVIE